jgi:hypothetical protein
MSRDLYVYIKTDEDLETCKGAIAAALEVEIRLPTSPLDASHGVFEKPENYFWGEIDGGDRLYINDDDTDLDYDYKIGIYTGGYDPEDYDDEFEEKVYRDAGQYVFDQLKATGRYSLLVFFNFAEVLHRFDLPSATKSEP